MAKLEDTNVVERRRLGGLNWQHISGALLVSAMLGSFASWRAGERNNIVLNTYVVPNLIPKGELLIQIGQLNKDIAENKLKIREIELAVERLRTKQP